MVITAGLIAIVGVVYRKFSNRNRTQSPAPSTWSDAESGLELPNDDTDSQGSVEVPVDTSDVESLGSISLDDDGPEVHSAKPEPVNFRGAKRATFTDKAAPQV